ncbi:MAG: hypothetical protein WCA28_21995 [Bradyrhizobium sp.]
MIGAIDGDVIGQIVGGHIGGISIELWQSGCICPSTHWQTHSAFAWATDTSNAAAASIIFILIFTRFAPS